MIALIILIIIIGLLLYFRPYLDIQRYKSKDIYILWYSYKGQRKYKYIGG